MANVGRCADCKCTVDFDKFGAKCPHDERKFTANDVQVGGTHYKTPTGKQHWDQMWDLFREAWFVGNVSKYLFRYREKNGVEDLKKARHYLDKLIELEEREAAKDQAYKAGVIPFAGPHPQGEVARTRRVVVPVVTNHADRAEPGTCRRCRKETDVGFLTSLCHKCFYELEAQL